MNVYELKEFLKCSKRYEFHQMILTKEEKMEKVRHQLNRVFCEEFLYRTEWLKIEHMLRNILKKSYEESWFPLEWQKRKAIRKELSNYKRLYHWMLSNIHTCGSSDCNFPLSINWGKKDLEGKLLEVHCDLLLEYGEERMLGIIIMEELPTFYQYSREKRKRASYESIDLITLFLALKQAYPSHKIDVKILSLMLPLDQDGILAMYEETEDSIMGFCEEDLIEHIGGNVSEELLRIIKKSKKQSCKMCEYWEVCNPPCVLHHTVTSISEKCKKDLSDFEFTEAQKKCIRHINGPMRLSAGPGAGKTATLVARIKFMIQEKGIKPKHILAITFTKKAVEEIMDRMKETQIPNVMTLHALGFSIIRMAESLIGKKRLVNRVDCMRLLYDILKKMPEIDGYSYTNLLGRNGMLEKLLTDFQYINMHGLQSFQEKHPFKNAETIRYVKGIYEERYQHAQYISYDELITLAYELLKKYNFLKKRVQDLYKFILIDEAQDLDEMQVMLVKELVRKPDCNIAIYGDADQSIYGFRGGSNRFMIDFVNEYPGALDIHLNHNFRSAEQILLASNRFISHNDNRVSFTMKHQFLGEKKPVLLQDFTIEHFGYWVMEQIKKGVPVQKIAIIARTNKELANICQIFDAFLKTHPENSQLKYTRPKYYLYEDYCFQLLLDLLHIYYGDYCDDAIWYRLLLASGMKIEKRDINRSIYDDYLATNRIYPFDGEEKTLYLSVNAQEDTIVMQAFAKIFRAILFFQLPPVESIKRVINFYCDASIDSQYTLKLLEDMINERGIRSTFDMYCLFECLKIHQDDTRVFYGSEEKERIQLLTAHDAKGKEYDTVFIYGLDNFERGDVEEDRRLLYVAMTRARKELYLTEIRKGKSMFLRELDKDIDKENWNEKNFDLR